MAPASLHSELMVDGEDEEDSSSPELDWKRTGIEGAFLMTLLWTVTTAYMMKKQQIIIIVSSLFLLLIIVFLEVKLVFSLSSFQKTGLQA